MLFGTINGCNRFELTVKSMPINTTKRQGAENRLLGDHSRNFWQADIRISMGVSICFLRLFANSLQNDFSPMILQSPDRIQPHASHGQSAAYGSSRMLLSGETVLR